MQQQSRNALMGSRQPACESVCTCAWATCDQFTKRPFRLQVSLRGRLVRNNVPVLNATFNLSYKWSCCSDIGLSSVYKTTSVMSGLQNTTHVLDRNGPFIWAFEHKMASLEQKVDLMLRLHPTQTALRGPMVMITITKKEY